MRAVQNLDEKLWKDFVDTHPHGNIFHTPGMFSVFAQTKGHRPASWATVYHKGHPLALLLPVYVTLLNGLLRQFTTRAIVYEVFCVLVALRVVKALTYYCKPTNARLRITPCLLNCAIYRT